MAYKGTKTDSHIRKHEDLIHSGEQADFVMRVVGSHESVLSRQISEVIRMMGGGEDKS